MTESGFYKDKLALVTGASSGIGRAVSVQLLEQGARIIAVGRDQNKLDTLQQANNGKFEERIETIRADLSDPEEVSVLLEQLTKMEDQDRISILVNNAGIGCFGPFNEHSWQTYQDLMQLNMNSLTRLTLHLSGKMRAHGEGAILNIASMAAISPVPNFSIYAASKAYVYSFSQALHHELKPYGVRVTVVNPGPTQTGFFDRAGKTVPEKKLRRMVSPETVARKALKGLKSNKLQVYPGLMDKILHKLNAMSPHHLSIPISDYYMKLKTKNQY